MTFATLLAQLHPASGQPCQSCKCKTLYLSNLRMIVITFNLCPALFEVGHKSIRNQFRSVTYIFSVVTVTLEEFSAVRISFFFTQRPIVFRGMVMVRDGFKVRQTLRSFWKVHDRVQFFVFRSHPEHELRKQHVFIG